MKIKADASIALVWCNEERYRANLSYCGRVETVIFADGFNHIFRTKEFRDDFDTVMMELVKRHFKSDVTKASGQQLQNSDIEVKELDIP